MGGAALRTEIASGPLAAGLAPLVEAGDDAGVAAVLSDRTRGETLTQAVPMLAFAKWAAGSGVRQKLRAGQSNPAVGAVCDTAIEMFGQLAITFDPTDPDTAAMMAGLVQAGVLAPADVAAAVARCTLPCGRAEKAGLVPPGGAVSAADVAAAFGRV